MIKVIDGLRDEIIGVTLSGTVSGNDYETLLMPLIEEKVAKYKKVRVLYHVDAGFESYDLKAMFDDTKIGFEFWSAYEKIALVSDVSWITNGMKAFSFLIPGEIKLFSNTELEKAKNWISEDK